MSITDRQVCIPGNLNATPDPAIVPNGPYSRYTLYAPLRLSRRNHAHLSFGQLTLFPIGHSVIPNHRLVYCGTLQYSPERA
jgi:hypothetical protein